MATAQENADEDKRRSDKLKKGEGSLEKDDFKLPAPLQVTERLMAKYKTSMPKKESVLDEEAKLVLKPCFLFLMRL